MTHPNLTTEQVMAIMAYREAPAFTLAILDETVCFRDPDKDLWFFIDDDDPSMTSEELGIAYPEVNLLFPK